jgi:hypothetical protein
MDLESNEIHISNSEMTTMRRCRRKWWLTYYRELKPAQRSFVGPLPLGGRVHKALEHYYKDGEDLLNAHARLIEEDRMEMLIEGFDVSELDDEAELGRIMLEGYLAWVTEEGYDADLEVISTEEILKFPIDPKSLPGFEEYAVSMMGKIDLRVLKRFAGTRSVLDFKTAASFSVWHDTAHMSTQLKLYMLLDRLVGNPSTRIDGGIFRLLKKVKRTARATPPFYEDVYIQHNDFTMKTFWFQALGVVREIMQVRKALDHGADPNFVAYPSPSADCRWSCNFVAACPLFDDGSDVDSILDEKFEKGDAYAYYGDISDGDKS